MEVEVGQRILIRFVAFSLETSTSCKYDYVTVVDGDGTTLLEKSCRDTPSEIVSKTNRADVIFKTDGSRTETGWKLEYSPMPGCVVLDPSTHSWIPGLRALMKDSGCPRAMRGIAARVQPP